MLDTFSLLNLVFTLAPMIIGAVGIVILLIVLIKNNKNKPVIPPVEQYINAVKQSPCDATVRNLSMRLQQKSVFGNVTTGVNYVNTRILQLLMEIIDLVQPHPNVSEESKVELFTSIINSDYLRTVRNSLTPQQQSLMDQAIQNSIMMDFQQQMDNNQLTQQMLQDQQQQFDQFQQQQMDQFQNQQQHQTEQIQNQQLDMMNNF